MQPHLRLPLTFLCALVFSLLFYHANPGINWFLFHLTLVFTSLLIDHSRLTRLRLLAIAALLSSSAFFVIHGSGWQFFVSLLAMGVFAGATAEPHLKTVLYIGFQGISNIVQSWFLFFRSLFLQFYNGGFLGNSLRHYYLVFPLLVVLLFIVMYSYGNPFFESYLGSFNVGLSEFWNWTFAKIDGQWVFLLILGGFISVFTLIPSQSLSLQKLNASHSEDLQRMRNGLNRIFQMAGLRKEHRAALLLLATLNILLFFVNLLDVVHVWIFFEWNGEYLKQFVHEGTWLLILSIITSIAVVLYYFRENLNYYPGSLLRKLTYAWIAQNAFLALSVCVRNLHYIDYFSLAYKRIAVMFFLALVLFGLYTVFVKVYHKKSMYYLIRVNSLSLMIAFLLSSAINWDVWITKYNFNHQSTGYLHFDFLVQMDISALPYLDHSLKDLKEMEASRNERFPVEEFNMTAETFYDQVQMRKEALLQNYPEKTWREWNLAEHMAYKQLMSEREAE